MPAHMVSLVGNRYGDAEVQRILRTGVHAGRPGYVYECLCHQCGTRFEAHQVPLRLGRITCCQQCRYRRECAVCGKGFSSKAPRATCSELCAKEKRRAEWLAHYYRAIEKNPELNKQRAAAARERIARDPDRARAAAEVEYIRGKRRRDKKTEADREKEREKARQRYAARRDEILARRRELLKEAGAERIAARRQWAREWWAANGAAINAQRRAKRQEGIEAARAYQRAWRLERRAALAAADLQQFSKQLTERLNTEAQKDNK